MRSNLLVLFAACLAIASAAQQCQFNYQCPTKQMCQGSASSCTDSSISVSLDDGIYIATNCLLGNGNQQLRIRHLTSLSETTTAVTQFTSQTLQGLDIVGVVDGILYGVVGGLLKKIDLGTKKVSNVHLPQGLVSNLVGGLLDGLLFNTDDSSLIGVLLGNDGLLHINLYDLDINLLGLVDISTAQLLVSLDPLQVKIEDLTVNVANLIVLTIDLDTKQPLISIYPLDGSSTSTSTITATGTTTSTSTTTTTSASKVLEPTSIVDGSQILSTLTSILYSSDDGIHSIDIESGLDKLIFHGPLADDIQLLDLTLYVSIGSKVIAIDLNTDKGLRLDVTLGTCAAKM